MSFELWNTVGTFGTFLVITATAIAAMIQLRHARSSNQIAALNELRASQSTPTFVRALQFVYSELPAYMQNPEFRYQLAHRQARTERYNEAISLTEAVGDSYESIGVLAKTGLVDRGPLLDFYAALVLDAWGALADVTAILRAHYGRALWENFEYLTVLSEDWAAKYPDGKYPRNVRRIDVPNKWHDADDKYAAGRPTAI